VCSSANAVISAFPVSHSFCHQFIKITCLSECDSNGRGGLCGRTRVVKGTIFVTEVDCLVGQGDALDS